MHSTYPIQPSSGVLHRIRLHHRVSSGTQALGLHHRLRLHHRLHHRFHFIIALVSIEGAPGHRPCFHHRVSSGIRFVLPYFVTMNPSTIPDPQRKRHVSQGEAYAGPGKELALPTPEQTLSPFRKYKRTRRKHGSSDEELPMTDFSAEVTKTDNYRVGSPHLANLPSSNIPLFEDSPFYKAWIAGLERLVIDSLQKFEVDWFEISAAARRCPLRDEPANQTILVLAHKTKPEDEWREAVIAARKLCKSLVVPNVSVKIADERGLKPKRSSTVGDGEPVLAAWPNLDSQIVEILRDTLWFAIELLRRGTDEDGINNPITVLITISESSTSD